LIQTLRTTNDFCRLDARASVFLDANTFVFHFQPHPQFGPSCTALLQRIEFLEIAGFTSTHVLSEVGHRLMTLEARSNLGWSSGKLLQRLKQNPAAASGLKGHQTAIHEVLQSRIQILTIWPPLFATASTLTQQHGLLTNDALIVALMQQHGLMNLASEDSDFDRVPGIARYAPA
jgi:predicted nucleic acid-binding protein